MPPHPFREALDALVDATYCSALADERGGQDEKVAWQERYAAARAEVERLYAARVGEEYEVTMVVNPEYPADRHYWDNGNIPTFPANYRLTPGVFRVTKGEAGVRSDCPIVGCTIAGPHDHNPTGPWEAKESA